MKSLSFVGVFFLFQRCGAFGVQQITCPIKSRPSNLQAFGHHSDSTKQSDAQPGQTRRKFWKEIVLTGSVLVARPDESWAGEVGARITKAITTSDLGLSVRTSVVRGAQVIDQIDGKWEKFSDQFGLGAERSKQGDRPKPKVIPDPLPLNIQTAQSILDICDRVFCAVTGVPEVDLQARIDKVANLVRISFERSGVIFSSSGSILNFETASQFNFLVYAHFKAFSELILERNIPFASFRSDFEKNLGIQLALYFQAYTSFDSLKSTEKDGRLQIALTALDKFLASWRKNGLVALTERSVVDEDQISDWLEGMADLEFTIALDGDVTLNSQVLLQEQGFRLYPSFCRYVVTYLLDQVSPSDQKVSAMDYYFDTDYNSDPDKFEVKEVLLSVQLESM